MQHHTDRSTITEGCPADAGRPTSRGGSKMQASYASHVAQPQGERTRFPFLKLYFFTAIVMLLADWIGSVTLNVGPGKVVLLPMVWAIIMGGLLGLLHKSMPAPLRLDTSL